MLVRDVTHETRDGGEASARTLTAPVMAVTEGRGRQAQEVAVSGRTGQEQPHATGRRQCVHAQRGRNARGERPGKAPKPAQEPGPVGPHDMWAHSVEQTETPESGC